MLCKMRLKQSYLPNQTSKVMVVDVPDDLYMYHMAAYGMFSQAALSDADLARCAFLGNINELECSGPYEPKERTK